MTMVLTRPHVLLLLLLLSPLFSPSGAHSHGAGGDDDDDGGSPASPTSSSPCSAQLTLPKSTSFPFSTNNFSCNSAWSSQSFTLMYQNTVPNIWSFVLTAPDNNDGSYISVGFSPTGMMVGSSAIAGWIPPGGAGVVKQYYLGGTSPNSCPPNQGKLKVAPGSMAIISQASTIYMGFQLTTNVPETKLIYAVGPTPKAGNLLPKHWSKTSTTIDYTTGQTSPSGAAGSSAGGNSKSSVACSSKLGVSSDRIPFNTSGLSCYIAWGSYDFTLFYKKSGPNLWSFVLSTPDTNAYVSIGFSKNGKMVGSSAIAGWKPAGSGSGTIKQYFLGGTNSDSCPPDQGDLVLAGKPVVVSQSSRLYLAFELNTSTPASNLIYAIGPQGNLPGSDFKLATHQDMTSTYLNYVTGESSAISSSTQKLRTAHGALGLLGWGVLVPIGVMVARYCKHWDPLWFYSHISIQGLGFLLGAICVFTGFSLEDKVGVDVDTHKTLGVIILVMGVLQVLALLVRPDKTAKIRRYWNWYHHNVGRVAIVLAVGNIFYGISLAHEDRSWNVGFGIFLGIWVFASICLEAWMRLRK